MKRRYTTSFLIIAVLVLQMILSNNVAQAVTYQNIPLSTTINGIVTTDSNNQNYKIVVQKTGKLNINLNSKVNDLYFRIQDQNSNDIYYTPSALASGATLSKSIYLAPGTYYLKVYDYSPMLIKGAYTLKLSFSNLTDGDIEPNNDMAHAQLLTLNYGYKTGYFTYGDQRDVYKFTVPASGKYTISIYSWLSRVAYDMSDAKGYPEWSNYTSGGNENSPSNMKQTGELKAGTHYLFVSHNYNDTGKYTIAISKGTSTYCTVNFNSYYGSSVPSATVIYNTKLAKPANPTRAGFTFGGWYSDSILIYPFDFTRAQITSNTTLYAKWIPNAPTGVKAISSGYNSAWVSWNEVSGVSRYEVYRSTASNGTYSKVAETMISVYSDNGLSTGTTYYYKIRPYILAGTKRIYGNNSIVVPVRPIPYTPFNVNVAPTGYNSVKASWNPVSGASGYEVYRATSSNGTYTKVGTTTSAVFTNVGLQKGTIYYYKIRAYRTAGKANVYSNFSAIISGSTFSTYR